MMRSSAPPHVSLILDGEIRLEGLTRELAAALRARGVRVRRSLWGGRSIGFDPTPSLPESAELARLLETLAELGFAFASDPRQGWAPEDIALELRARGKLHGRLLACGFDGSRWQLREVAPHA